MTQLTSARFWIAIIMTISGCVLNCYGLIKDLSVPDSFNHAWVMVLTFYFLKSRPKEDPLHHVHKK